MNKKHNSGFTLLEVLIALLVLSVGLLGLASLQTRGLATGHNAYLRSQAVLLARDMAERIRTNANYVLATEETDQTIYTVDYNQTPTDTDCSSNSCSPAQLAQYDIDQWLTSLTNTLPTGDGQITKTGIAYVITVRWDSERTGNIEDLKSYSFNLNLRSS
ncbi:MAG: type IV pilus modification protein PilV [Gammaproteobacteria bacterium]|nr:type IV pilus modification protein PilV [Gammaproteobacteria bacterium]